MTALTITITGCDGFIGRNLAVRLGELGHRTIGLNRSHDRQDWLSAVSCSDAIFHLAGANRPEDPADFETINVGCTELIVSALEAAKRSVPVVYASSIRADGDDAYGRSKRAAEAALLSYADRSGNRVYIFRLPNVFGKWARPNYNSAVATFCHNVARDLPLVINDDTANIQLVYIDDVIDSFISVLAGRDSSGFADVAPVYSTTVGAVAGTIRGFRADRAENLIDNVGKGLTRALYATYVAALPPLEFSYPIASHRDPRGAFSEVLKTRSAGQFSYFTAFPGVTRGGHYHHTKTEKFLIVSGRARFRFRQVLTGETYELETNGDAPTIVETVPGWAHDVTNIGDDVMISLLWANEVFDRDRPDTRSSEV